MKEYLVLADRLFGEVEDLLANYEDLMDYDLSPGKIEISFESGGSKVVLNTQRAIHEVWLAGNARAWHFRWRADEGRWFAEAEGVEFWDALLPLLGARAGVAIQRK